MTVTRAWTRGRGTKNHDRLIARLANAPALDLHLAFRCEVDTGIRRRPDPLPAYRDRRGSSPKQTRATANQPMQPWIGQRQVMRVATSASVRLWFCLDGDQQTSLPC